ncbi:TRAP transporter substrate-binding protein [Arenibaculum sp.]|jgi:TRAP-type C4-dicarboxylate transport system substrate-binding protein|uniref:TRAP transporter substrate-binding protein n=1 Tax=Arenibaculum sp. TaxID=2865862 RepID=UPI002E0D6666|nr:TRAP transporter substrate-binding protein [Arenibaculum sp.]
MKSVLRFTAVMLVAAFTGSAAAQDVVWTLINEYPATSLTAEADASFAAAVERRIGDRVVIEPIPDAKSGLRTREQLAAVSDGRHAMANSFGGALADESPFFLLSSLPFLTSSVEDSRTLYEVARPTYEKLFAERNQKLLYVTPWPPTGLWSDRPVDSADALRALRIRTYDQTSMDLFARVATTANVISFSDLEPRLASGEYNAVLSSGDGGAGRQLWRHLRHFSSIVYAVPLSFASVSLKAWNALDDATRAEIEAAARETTERNWAAIAGRVERNFATMRSNGVVIDEQPPAEMMQVLHAAATQSIADWRRRTGSEGERLLADYDEKTPEPGKPR